jgi:hypothetical protein
MSCPGRTDAPAGFLLPLDPLQKRFTVGQYVPGLFVLFRESVVKRFALNLRGKSARWLYFLKMLYRR